MTTGLQTKQAGNADLDAVFDPYVQGTSPPATGFNVGGTTTDINTRFAPIVFGSAAAATGLQTKQSGNADLNTLFAAYGTASYALPIDGTIYTQGVTIFSAGSGNANLTFQTSASTYTVTGNGAGGTLSPAAGTRASGSAPSGAATVQYTTAVTSGSGGTVTNGASTPTALSGNPSVIVQQTGSGTGPGNDVRYSVKIDYRNSGGTVISSTTIYFDVSYEGSA